MGARPVPTPLKLLKGTAQPCRVRPDEPKPEADKIIAPRGLSKAAAREFRRLKRELLACKVLTNLDVDALAMLATAVAEMKKIQKDLDRTGIMVRGRHGYPVISPLFRAAKQAQEQVRRMLLEFGMTPAARTRVGTTSGGDGDGDEFGF